MKTAEEILEKLNDKYELAHKIYKDYKEDEFRDTHETAIMWTYSNISDELKYIIDWIESEEKA